MTLFFIGAHGIKLLVSSDMLLLCTGLFCDSGLWISDRWETSLSCSFKCLSSGFIWWFFFPWGSFILLSSVGHYLTFFSPVGRRFFPILDIQFAVGQGSSAFFPVPWSQDSVRLTVVVYSHFFLFALPVIHLIFKLVFCAEGRIENLAKF